MVPHTLLAQVIDSGRPVLVDLLTNQAGTVLVSQVRLDDPEGRVIGALGMVLMDHPERAEIDGGTMQPLIVKFSRLQRELADAQRQLAAEQTRNRRPEDTIVTYIGARRHCTVLRVFSSLKCNTCWPAPRWRCGCATPGPTPA